MLDFVSVVCLLFKFPNWPEVYKGIYLECNFLSFICHLDIYVTSSIKFSGSINRKIVMGKKHLGW